MKNADIVRLENKINELILLLSEKKEREEKDKQESALNTPMLYEWLEKWLNEYKAPKIKPKSLAILRSGVENYIKSNIKNKPLDKCRSSEMLATLEKVPYSYMRQVVYSIFRSAFKRAYQFDLIKENPSSKLDFVKHKRKKGKALTIEEQKNFLKAIDSEPMKNLWLFYLLSGCRCSEILNLKWSDIDYKQKRIFIRGTKTENAERYIPLFPEIAKILKNNPKKSENVFNYTLRAIQWNFNRIRRQNGFKFRIHDLRHTFATRCLESGINIKTVSKWLGHKNTNTTSDIYSHILTDFEKGEIEKFNPKIEFVKASK